MKRLALIASLVIAASAIAAAHAFATDTSLGTCRAIVSSGGAIEQMGMPGTSDLYQPYGYQRGYCLYVPKSYSIKKGGPLVVVLHGCTTWAPTAAYETQFNKEADRVGFAVVYPQEAAYSQYKDPTAAHPIDGNGSYCWNWFLPDQLNRSSPEPWMIANITRKVMRAENTDPRRVYVIGMSAGGAMANNMGVLYPDLFAATAVVAGCEYAGASCLGSDSAVPASASGKLAFDAAGPYARVMPFLVENGDADAVVPVENAYNDVVQWQTYDALAAQQAPAPSLPCAHSQYVPDPSTLKAPDAADPLALPNQPHAYDTFSYQLDGGSPCSLGQLIIVHGEGHAYPGGAPRRYFPTEDGYYDIWSDPLGPDLTDIAYRFFMAHPCHLAKGICR